MSKRKISQRQADRIKKIQQQHITEPHLQNSQHGLVVAHYGTYVDVETADQQIIRCNLRQNLGSLVVGDQVAWQQESTKTNVVVAVLPRTTLLSRPISSRKDKAIAANIDQVILVIAPQPQPASTIIDSYLVAIEALHVNVVLLLNKIDLITNTEESQLIQQKLATYQEIGYPFLRISTYTGEGFIGLKNFLKNHKTVFVGQSGVGKSSIIANLLPEELIRLPKEQVLHSLHTTTTARLYHLPEGGDLIDSPGIREFSLGAIPIAAIAAGFREFRPHMSQCKFRNCTHQKEPDCAVRAGVTSGEISAARFESYQRIVSSLSIP